MGWDGMVVIGVGWVGVICGWEKRAGMGWIGTNWNGIGGTI